MSTLHLYEYCTVATQKYYASGRERDAGRLYESGYKKRMKKKNGT